MRLEKNEVQKKNLLSQLFYRVDSLRGVQISSTLRPQIMVADVTEVFYPRARRVSQGLHFALFLLLFPQDSIVHNENLINVHTRRHASADFLILGIESKSNLALPLISQTKAISFS
jgi:hypothetical protein